MPALSRGASCPPAAFDAAAALAEWVGPADAERSRAHHTRVRGFSAGPASLCLVPKEGASLTSNRKS